MEIADVLYGVSMAGDGISTRALAPRRREPRGRSSSDATAGTERSARASAPRRAERRAEAGGAARAASSRACARTSAAPAARSRRASHELAFDPQRRGVWERLEEA